MGASGAGVLVSVGAGWVDVGVGGISVGVAVGWTGVGLGGMAVAVSAGAGVGGMLVGAAGAVSPQAMPSSAKTISKIKTGRLDMLIVRVQAKGVRCQGEEQIEPGTKMTRFHSARKPVLWQYGSHPRLPTELLAGKGVG